MSVRLALTGVCLCLPLCRGSSSVQQIPALPEYLCFPSSSLSEVLSSFVFCYLLFDFPSFSISDFFFLFYCRFALIFPVLLVLLCSRTRHADTSLARHLKLRFTFIFGLLLSHSLCPQNQYLSRTCNQDGYGRILMVLPDRP